MKTKKKRFREFANLDFDAELPAIRKSSKKYELPLGPDDRIKVRFDIGKREGKSAVVNFSVQYETRVDDSWRAVVRVDGSEFEKPHRHIFSRNGKERKEVLCGVVENYAILFHETQQSLRLSHEVLKENFVHQD